MTKKRRRVIRDLEADKKKAPARQADKELRRSMYPLGAPGMPMPGPDFVEHARRLGEETETTKVKVMQENGRNKTVTQMAAGEILHGLYRRALRDSSFQMPVQAKPGTLKTVSFVPGHIWGQHSSAYRDGKEMSVTGPSHADVMVIGKTPGAKETEEKRNFVGEAGELFLDGLRQMKVKGMGSWYVTNLVKFQTPDGQSRLRSGWVQDCMPLLQQELRLVRPKYILCLGTDASKALLGKSYSVGYMEGRVVEYEFPIHLEDDPEKEVIHKCLVMTIPHPNAVLISPETRPSFESGLARFNLLKNGIRFDKEEEDLDHRTIETLEQLKDLLDEIEHDPRKKDKIIAVDAEWHGEHPQNAGSYVRTIQFAWRPKCACAVVLRAPGGKIHFRDENGKPAIKRAIKLLNKFFEDKRVVGHFFVADLEWLVDLGLDLRDSFRVPLYDIPFKKLPKGLRHPYRQSGFKRGETIPAWARTLHEGGADTGLMAHAIEETAMLRLESLALRYTTVPRYDVPLHDWRQQWCRENDKKAKDLEGYGECPGAVLIPYGIYDADATLRLYYALVPLLDADYEGNCCREPFWESMIITPGILEMHCNGITVDKPRVDDLTEAFMTARAKTEQTIQDWAKWPDFNIRSVFQVREFLFGEHLNGKVIKDPNVEFIQIRPEKAKSLYIEPLLDTGKPPKQWWQIKARGLEKEHNASTNKSVLSILAQDNDNESKQINWIRDYRFLDQVLKSLLRPPVTDKEGNWIYEEDSTGGDMGGLVFDAGLASVVCDDGKVRTHLYPTADTGRWKSARPNLQNISKQRDPDYVRLLGDRYKHKLRSILKASPGHVLVEVDYIGAELYGMAMMSGDAAMIDHCQRNQLPEDDPNFYDIHSNVACLAFKLDCPATKTGLKGIGKAHLRIIAKNVIFGIAYGRGAKAIALQAKEQGVDITVPETQQVIDTLFEMYPGLTPFFDECRSRSQNPGWLCNCFGRFRRYPQTDNFKLKGEYERQAMNFPVQSLVAGAVDRAVAYLEDYRREVGEPDLYKMVLQIHDAVLFEVPYKHVERFLDEVAPLCMVKRVPIYPTKLDGIPTGEGPYYLGIDSDVMIHWGENITKEEAKRLGIPEVTRKGTRIAA